MYCLPKSSKFFKIIHFIYFSRQGHNNNYNNNNDDNTNTVTTMREARCSVHCYLLFLGRDGSED